MSIDKFGRHLFSERCFDNFYVNQILQSATPTTQPQYFYYVPFYFTAQTQKNSINVKLFCESALTAFPVPFESAQIVQITIAPTKNTLLIKVSGQPKTSDDIIKGISVTNKDVVEFEDPGKSDGKNYIILIIFKCPIVVEY